MKKILLFLPLVFMCFGAMAQKQIVVAGDPVCFESTIQVDSAAKKDALYARGRDWATAWYKSADAVIGAQDNGSTVTGKSSFITVLRLGGLYGTKRYHVNYTYKLSFKDGQSSIMLSDFYPDRHPVLKDGRIEQYQSIFGRRIARRTYAGLIQASKNYSAAVMRSYTDYLISHSREVTYSKIDDRKADVGPAAQHLE